MVTPDLTLSSKVRKLVAPAALGFVCLLLYHSWATNSTTYHSLQAPALALIPKKIWYKLGPTGLSYKARNWTGTCAPRNPGYVAELLTNETSESWVRTVYASRRPDFVEGYLAAPGPNPQGRSSCGTHSSSPRAASGPTPRSPARGYITHRRLDPPPPP